MNVFESLNETSNKAVDIGEKYVETSHQYLKLKVFQQVTSFSSLFGKMLLIGGMMIIALLFLALSAAVAIGYWVDNLAIGMLIMGGVFILIMLIIYLLRRRIDKFFIKKVSQKFFDK
ncbi:hypothetical protein [Formosa haliotis]|uniref:hypothetical protein n=1 Tax=Formosa haliotis TaxID=1555194 RepID=UPI0008269D76|nr:hypothetical protein [Formosa haliotis]